jgi:hypothetical protein
MGFEPKIPASELAKTVHALDRAATVAGNGGRLPVINLMLYVAPLLGRTGESTT